MLTKASVYDNIYEETFAQGCLKGKLTILRMLVNTRIWKDAHVYEV